MLSRENADFETVERETRAAEANRVVEWFTLPAGLSKKLGLKKVGLVELTSNEELMCASRSRNEPVRLAIELMKESVRFADGLKLNTGDGSADTFWASRKQGMSALRQLLLAAYNQVHNPTGDDTASFLQSRQSTI
jgi:hypothetical protein